MINLAASLTKCD